MRKLFPSVVVVLLAACAALLSGCGGSGAGDATASASTTGGATTTAAAVPRWKVWLCRPGLTTVDWCNADMRVTNVYANGSRKVVLGPAAPKRPIDCFYVYPSLDGNPNDLKIDEPEKAIAIIQASRFGQACRIFAPLYRQNPGTTAYRDVRAAWRDYLAHHNKGRGVALIGHSQGAYVLEQLIQEEIEGRPVQRQLVSAILLGGSVSVAKGSDTGGTFKQLPACRKKEQSGCVVAYSTWSRTPPKDASFEDVDGPNQQILCVNPADPGADRSPVTPLFPWFAPEGIVISTIDADTMWVALPGKYTARCVTEGRRAWLLIENVGPVGDKRELVREVLQAGWGLHAADVNIALEQLVELVRAQGKAWAAGR